MKKYCSKLLAILCAVCLTVSAAIPSFAADISNEPQEYATTAVTRGPITFPVSFGSDDIALYDQFAAMSDAELVTYLNNLSPTDQFAYDINSTQNMDVSVAKMRGLIAVAALFVKRNLPCAAELVLHALSDEDYTETDGLFSQKIKTTPTFLNWVPTATSTLYEPVIPITEDNDLYYALRAVKLSSPYSVGNQKMIYCNDTFDFEGQERFETLLATILNEGAWILTCWGVLYEIDVHIAFFY